MRVWPYVIETNQVGVAAVIFADGTHVGHVTDNLCGSIDVVLCIFETRQGWADALSGMAAKITALTNKPKALNGFLGESATSNPSRRLKAGVNAVHDRAMNNELDNARGFAQQKLNEVRKWKNQV